jgi:hypothetical protein
MNIVKIRSWCEAGGSNFPGNRGIVTGGNGKEIDVII